MVCCHSDPILTNKREDTWPSLESSYFVYIKTTCDFTVFKVFLLYVFRNKCSLNA